MKDENINMDKLLREKLEGFSVPPAPHVWDSVQGQLLAQKKKRRMAYFTWISAAAVVVLAFIAGWYFNNSSTIETPISAEKQLIQAEKENIEQIVATQKTLNSESISIQEQENKNIEIEKESVDKIKSTLIAEGKDPKAEMVDTDAYPVSERLEMQTISGKKVDLNSPKPETVLLQKSIQVNEFEFSETDNLILAANVTQFEQTGKKESGWKMGMNVAPGYSSQVTNHSASYTKNMNSSGQSGNGSIGAGLSFQYKTSKKLRIESGVYYAQSGQKSNNPITLFAQNKEYSDLTYDVAPNTPPGDRIYGFGNAVNLSNGNLLMNSTAGVIEMNGTPKGVQINSTPESIDADFANSLITDGTFSQVFDFIEIPLYLRYSLLDSKFGIELLGGLNAGVVVGNSAYIDNSYGVQNIGTTQDISTLNLAGTVGVGASYSLGKHVSVAVEPRLNYYFNSINTNPNVVYHPYRIGFYTGLYYEF